MATLTVDTALAWVNGLLATPPLKMSVEGGGLPEPHSISLEAAVLVCRADLEDLKRILARCARKDRGAR